MSYNQQHFNPYQQGQQQYGAPYQMSGQINQNQQFYSNPVNQQQQQHDDFGDFVSSSTQNNTNQQNNNSTQSKYDAFNNLQGPSGFKFHESPQKPAQKQGQNQAFMNGSSATMNFNAQTQNQLNLAANHVNGQYGYGNVINQNMNVQNLQLYQNNPQQYQAYQQQQLQQQQFQQAQIYQQQTHLINQNQGLHQQFQSNQLQHLQNPQQVNQFYAQNQVQMAQAALNNPQYQAQINLAMQQQQKLNLEDDFGDFSTASTTQNSHNMPGSLNPNTQVGLLNMMNNNQLQQNFQNQGYLNQDQKLQQNQMNLTQTSQVLPQNQTNNAFNSLQNVNLQSQNNLNGLNQQQLNWQQPQAAPQQIQKNSDDFGDFSDAPTVQTNLNAPTQNLNQFQSVSQTTGLQNLNMINQPQIVPNLVSANKQAEEDDFGDFTSSHQTGLQTTNIQQISNLNALNVQNLQPNLAALNQQQQQPKLAKQDSDDFGDFTTVQSTTQQPITSQGVLPQPNLVQNLQNNVNLVQPNANQVSNINSTLQPNNLQALQSAFGGLNQEEKNNVKKESDDFGDFEGPSVTVQNQLQQQNHLQSDRLNVNQALQNSAQKSDGFGDFEGAPATVQNHTQQNHLQRDRLNVNQIQQNSAQKSDGFGDFIDAEPQPAATSVHVPSFNQIQQNQLPQSNQNHTAQQKISDDFGDFIDTTNVSNQPQSQTNVQQDGLKKYNVFYELEQKAQESQPNKVSVLDMPIEVMTNQQQNNNLQNQKQQDLFGDEENEDDFGDFQDTKHGNQVQLQAQQQYQQQQMQIQNQNNLFNSEQQQNNNLQNQSNALFVSQLPQVKKSGAEIEKELIGNVISLFDDYKVDHLTDKNKLFQNQNPQQIQQQPATQVQPQQNVQVQNKVEDDEFGDFADFQDSKQPEKVAVQPIHAYELDWDSIIKQNQQGDNDLQPQDQLQEELQEQVQQESKLNQNKKNHTNDLFEEHSSQNNARATSSIQDNNQGDHTSSQAETLTLDFEKNLKAKKNQKKNDFEDDLQADLGVDDDFGDFESSNKHQHAVNVPQTNYSMFQSQNTINNNLSINPNNNNNSNVNDDLFDDFEQATYQPQQQSNPAPFHPQPVTQQLNNANDDDLFGDFLDNNKTEQPQQQQLGQQNQNNNSNDDFDDFDDFESAPAQQTQQQVQQSAPVKQEVKVMDLKEFEMNTFDITALDYGESAKQKAEQQKREQERKKQEEEERKRQQQLELEKQKQEKLNSIPQFVVGKQIYRGQYWRDAYENDNTYFADNKFYDDLIQEIDSLGLYQHFEKLITIREGLNNLQSLEQQKQKAKNEQDYEKMHQIKQQINEINSQKDYKEEMMSLVYQIIACEGKCFNHLIYERIAKLENAMLFVKQFQAFHDQNRDVDEMIDFMIIATTIDNNYTTYVHKLYQVQEVCQKEIQLFEQKMKQFHALPTQAKQQIVSSKQFTDFIQASTQLLYHGKRYSKISASLNSQLIEFDILEKMITNNILILNKQFNTSFEQIKKNFSFTEGLTQEQREKLINDIVNRESNLHLNEFICNLCLGVANETRVHYRGNHYHNLCINVWFNKISTIIE